MARGQTPGRGAIVAATEIGVPLARSCATNRSNITRTTRTERLLALTHEQRRFEWDLARDQQTRAAAQFVSGYTHDLLNLVQIVQLATLQLANECGPSAIETIDELASTATAARGSLRELLAVARPDTPIVRGAPVRASIEAALASVRDALPVDSHLDLPPDTATRCTASELAHLVIGMVLDVGDPAVFSVELHVRQRTIVGVPWVEIVRVTPRQPRGDRFELRAVDAIVGRAAGELATSQSPHGGFELIVALPVVEPNKTVSSLA